MVYFIPLIGQNLTVYVHFGGSKLKDISPNLVDSQCFFSLHFFVIGGFLVSAVLQWMVQPIVVM